MKNNKNYNFAELYYIKEKEPAKTKREMNKLTMYKSVMDC